MHGSTIKIIVESCLKVAYSEEKFQQDIRKKNFAQNLDVLQYFGETNL
jgi:hypothetical protein